MTAQDFVPSNAHAYPDIHWRPLTPADRAAFLTLAEALHYPGPGSLDVLELGLSNLPNTPLRRSFGHFMKGVRPLRPHEFEELYTRTLELAPLTAVYVGYQVWGDAYPRGEFMAALNRTYADMGLDTQGELPDHLGVILRYLAQTPEPLPELRNVLEPSVKAMHDTLKTLEPRNPYLHLLDAVESAVQALRARR